MTIITKDVGKVQVAASLCHRTPYLTPSVLSLTKCKEVERFCYSSGGAALVE